MFKNSINAARRLGRSVQARGAAVGSGLMAAGVSAHAAVPTAVTDKVAEIETDISTMGGLILVLALVLAGFLWMRRSAK